MQVTAITKIIVSIIIGLFVSISMMAQPLYVEGTITDNKNLPISGSNVILLNKIDSSFVKGTNSNYAGKFHLAGLQPGNYILKINYLGFKDNYQHFSLIDKPVLIGIITLQVNIKSLDEIVIKEKIPAVKINGDTTEYNSSIAKVNPDAVAEDLVSKIPGITIENGKVKSNGEEIKKVLIDGKEFFGDDPSIALKYIPADMIDKIQIYDKSSDQAEFTGFKENDKQKTMNLKTKNSKSNGIFGKISGGLGTGEHYTTGGNINYFNNNRRISAIGMSNNINQQNFSTQDLLGISSGSGNMPQHIGASNNGTPRMGAGMNGPPAGGSGSQFNSQNFNVGTSSGINSSNSIGLNYIDSWGEKWDVNGSYFYNHSKNKTTAQTDRTYFLTGISNQYYNETSNTESNNFNHRINLRMKYRIDTSNFITIIPSLNFQKNSSTGLILGTSRSNENTILNNILNDNNNNLSGYNFSNTILYGHKFVKTGRTFSINFVTSLNGKDGNNTLISYSKYYASSDSSESNNQKTNTITDGKTISCNLTYTEPLSNNSRLMFSYFPSFSNSQSSKLTNQYDDTTSGYTKPDKLLSNIFDYTTLTQRGGASYRFKKNKISLLTSLDFQTVTLDGHKTYPDNNITKVTFQNFMPRADLFYNISARKFFHLGYFTYTQLPNITQLQDVIDNSNPLSLSQGNPNLKQQYFHSLMSAFRVTDATFTRSFMIFINGSMSDNYIANTSLTATKDSQLTNGFILYSGSQLATPVNLSGYKNLRTFFTVGLPLYFIKSNLNISGGYTYTKLPGIIDKALNYSRNSAMNIGLAINSNINEKIDFRISYTANYNEASNTIQTSSNQNYYVGNGSAKINLIPLKHFVLSGDITLTHYSGLGDTYNKKIVLCNAGLGYKFLKNESAEFRISAYDLLNQNNHIIRNINNNYVEDVETIILKQYFMISFTYQIKNFLSNNSRKLFDRML